MKNATYLAQPKLVVASVWLSALLASVALAASFGSSVGVSNLKVQSIWKGHTGPIYVSFTPAIVTGCSNNAGGYLTSTWSDALGGGTPDQEVVKQQLALLLTAKASDTMLTVYYRVNSAGTGWDKCAFDAIWIQ